MTPGDTFAKAVATVEEMSRQGKSWRVASRAVNAARLVPSLRAMLKSAYEAAYASRKAEEAPEASSVPESKSEAAGAPEEPDEAPKEAYL